MGDRTATLTDAATRALPERLGGARIGRFEVLGALGAGGMGVVLLARDPQLERKVAIKLLHPDAWPGVGSAARERVRREAQAMARVAHPNVVSVFEIGEADDRDFIVMELVDGETLKSWLRRAPRSWQDVVAMFVAAGRGLEAAHAAGLVHRDFKPSNVLVGKDARPRISDFGLVTPHGGADRDEVCASFSATGAVGTLGYMSPEHLEAQELGFAADQFSFCAALYEALYGELPFSTASLAEHQESIRRGLPLAPPVASPVPARIWAVIRRGLQVDSSARWPSMRELVAELEGAGAEPRRRRVGRWSLALAVTAAITGSLLFFVRAQEGRQPRRADAIAQTQATFIGDVVGWGLSPDGKVLAYGDGRQLSLLELETRRERGIPIGGRVQLLSWLPDSSAIHVNVASDGGPGVTASYIVRRDGTVSLAARLFAFGASSPDGRDFASADVAHRRVDLWREGRLDASLAIDGTYSALWVEGWSHDGRWLLVSSVSPHNGRTRLWLVSADRRTDNRLLADVLSVVPTRGMDASFVAGDRGIVYLASTPAGDRTLFYVPFANGRLGVERPVLEGWHARTFQLSADGRRAAFLKETAPSTLWLADIEERRAKPSLRWRRVLSDATPKGRARFSPDGSRLLYVANNGWSSELLVVPVVGGAPTTISQTIEEELGAAWSPDGREVAVMVGDSPSLSIFRLGDGSKRVLPTSPLGQAPGRDLSWAPSPFISYRLSGDHDLGLLDPRTLAERRLRRDESGSIRGVEWSPDGRRAACLWRRAPDDPADFALAVIDGDGSIRALADGLRWPVGWSADGRWIYASEPSATRISKVAAAGGRVEPWVELDRAVSDCRVSLDARRLACTGDYSADVWLLDDFDELLPR